MDCAGKKELRDKLPEYGALAGLVVGGLLWKNKSFPNWNVVEAFAGTATLGYLGGFLAVPLVKKCSAAELEGERGAGIEGVVGIDDVSSITDEYAGYGSQRVATHGGSYGPLGLPPSSPDQMRVIHAACGPFPGKIHPWERGGPKEVLLSDWVDCSHRALAAESAKGAKLPPWAIGAGVALLAVAVLK